MTFLNICPRDKVFLTNNKGAIPLRVLTSPGVDTTPDSNIIVSDLSKGYKHFYNNKSNGYTFSITVLIKKEDTFNGKPLTKVLDEYYRNSTPLLVHTDAIDVNSTSTYIITKNPSRKQTDKYTTLWELELTVYNSVSVFKFKNDNAGVRAALKKNSGLRKCNYKTLVYSKKKKTVKCVKYMQQILYKNKLLKKKYVNGWFGNHTKKAVKQFQKNYNKKHKKTNIINTSNRGIIVREGKLIKGKQLKITPKNTSNPKISKRLPVTGKVDKATWKALCNS